MALTTVQTSVRFNQSVAEGLVTPRQMNWLKYAIADYNLKLDLDTVQTVGQASQHITRIQNAINSGKLTKKEVITNPVITHIWYVVIKQIDVISIKSFTGSKIEASAKAKVKYGDSVRFESTNIEEAKAKALELRALWTEDEVACGSTTTTTELLMDEMKSMDIPALRQLAEEMGVDLGRSKARNTIIARILA